MNRIQWLRARLEQDKAQLQSWLALKEAIASLRRQREALALEVPNPPSPRIWLDQSLALDASFLEQPDADLTTAMYWLAQCHNMADAQQKTAEWLQAQSQHADPIDTAMFREAVSNLLSHSVSPKTILGGW